MMRRWMDLAQFVLIETVMLLVTWDAIARAAARPSWEQWGTALVCGLACGAVARLWWEHRREMEKGPRG